MHSLDLVVIVGYVLLIIIVGLRVASRVKDAKDFFLAGRSLTWWVIGLSIIDSNIDTNSYVGASGNAYTIGIAQANFEWMSAIPAMIIASLIFIPLYWRAGVYDFEYLGLRYNQAVRVVTALITSLFAVFAMGVAMWALALVLETYLGWPIWMSILISGAVVGLYSITGGLAAVAFTDALQVSIMFFCGIIIVGLGISELGGFTEFSSALTKDNPDHLSVYLPADHPQSPWPESSSDWVLYCRQRIGLPAKPSCSTAWVAKSQWDASASMMFAAFAHKTFVPLLIIFPGLLALVLNAPIDDSDKALPWIIKNVLPPGHPDSCLSRSLRHYNRAWTPALTPLR